MKDSSSRAHHRSRSLVLRSVAALLVVGMARAHAQTHYFNLDAGRPTRIEDAIATERYALDLHLAPVRFERMAGGTLRWRTEPKLAFGVAPFTELEVRAPILYTRLRGARNPSGLGGIGVAALRTLNLETGARPATALAAEVLLPAGALAPARATYSGRALLTKTTAVGRVHLNASFGTWALPPAPPPDPLCTENCGGVLFPDVPCAVSPVLPLGVRAARTCGAGLPTKLARVSSHVPARDGARWMVGVAADHAFPLRSMLVSAAVFAEHFRSLYPRADWTAEVGVRKQVTPVLVVDLGAGRRFTGSAPSTMVTFGLTYDIALRPGAASRAPDDDPRRPRGRGVYGQTHLAAPHNWEFRGRFPEVDRLFNAFDYGHAVMYEHLWRSPSTAAAALENEEHSFITRRILVSPPAVQVEERAVGPEWSTLAPEVLAMFEWAHVLHRQLYDVLADDRIWPADRDSRVREVIRYYQSRPDLAFSTSPKSMDLMEGQRYSLAFRQQAPKFNALIWSYHWLQMVLYDALLTAGTPQERRAHVDAAVQRFRELLVEAPSMPSVMPMSAAIAPAFSAAWPDAAIIFDNLHSLHDVVGDILASPVVPREEKRAQILRAAAAYRDATTAVTTRAEWLDMSRAMGVEQMGGAAPRP